MPAGYSGTPLAKKLGVFDGQRTWRVAMPTTVATEIALGGVSPKVVKTPLADLQMAHLFVTRRSELARKLVQARRALAQDGVIWVSWPKRAAKVPTDITEDTVRAEAFPLELVDVKVCAVDDVWSGLKLVIRKSNRI
jgi:hypothetical protein